MLRKKSQKLQLKIDLRTEDNIVEIFFEKWNYKEKMKF